MKLEELAAWVAALTIIAVCIITAAAAFPLD